MRNREYQLLYHLSERRRNIPKPKQYKYLYAKMMKESTIRAAWKKLRKGKSKRPEVISIEKHFEENIKRMQTMIENTKPVPVEHPELGYKPVENRKTKMVNERGKMRLAYMAEIWEQWYFHIICYVLQPIVMRRLHKESHGSIPGRGPHSGKKHIEKIIKEGKVVKYFLKLDIRHFYDSLQIHIVIRELRNDIADEWFLYCIAIIYKYVKKGIMIGLYISPWLANYVLIGVDDFILSNDKLDETRYMDDFSIFAASKKALFRILDVIRTKLSKLRLKVKRNYTIAKFDYITKKTNEKGEPIRIGKPLDFMGFVFYRDRVVIRKHIMIDTTRLAKKMYKAKQADRGYYEKHVRGFLSKMGWFSHTDSYGCYEKYIKPYVKIKKCKQIVSKIDKRRNRENGYLEGRAVLHKTGSYPAGGAEPLYPEKEYNGSAA